MEAPEPVVLVPGSTAAAAQTVAAEKDAQMQSTSSETVPSQVEPAANSVLSSAKSSEEAPAGPGSLPPAVSLEERQPFEDLPVPVDESKSASTNFTKKLVCAPVACPAPVVAVAAQPSAAVDSSAAEAAAPAATHCEETQPAPPSLSLGARLHKRPKQHSFLSLNTSNDRRPRTHTGFPSAVVFDELVNLSIDLVQHQPHSQHMRHSQQLTAVSQVSIDLVQHQPPSATAPAAQPAPAIDAIGRYLLHPSGTPLHLLFRLDSHV